MCVTRNLKDFILEQFDFKPPYANLFTVLIAPDSFIANCKDGEPMRCALQSNSRQSIVMRLFLMARCSLKIDQ
jgi:hypothetical protein